MKTVVIAFLDKNWPPEHSFVDGMLATLAAQQPELTVRLCVSRTKRSDQRARKYLYASCLPRLHIRRNFGRLLNLWTAVRLIEYQARREKARGKRVVLFIRNDPIYLLASSLMRYRVDHLVFQSSFPHEEFSGSMLKRFIARTIYRFSSTGVDIVTGVTPEGTRRASRLCKNALEGPFIPLLSDLSHKLDKDQEAWKNNGVTTFIYTGTHHKNRELEVVLSAIVRAVQNGAIACFQFVGATEEDEKRLSKESRVNELLNQNIISFRRSVPRSKLINILAKADVGLSLIPPNPEYYESSPTKLTEYMGAGLAVLASRGIPMQEWCVNKSKGGLLVDWNVEAISQGIQTLCTNNKDRLIYAKNAATFARESLQYKYYLPHFRNLIGLNSIPSNNNIESFFINENR